MQLMSLMLYPMEKNCLICPLMLQRVKGVFKGENAPTPVNTKEVIEQLVTAKRASNRREIYVKSLGKYCSRFGKKFPDLRKVGLAEIESWLSQFQSAASRQTWLNRLSTMFSFAVKRGLLMMNPCERIDRITIDRKDPVVLTVEQAKALLASCPDHVRAYLALAMFAGVRPDEIMRMTWGEIDLETKTARVNGKTRRRRIVPLEPVAADMLRACPEKSGNVAPSRSTVRRWIRKARELIGGKWDADILRHSAASYLLAKYEDAGKVAMWLGNSPQVLLTRYNNPRTKEEAEKFWSLTC